MRRTLLLLATMALGLLLASGVALAATEVVTKSFKSSSLIHIRDATAAGPGLANPYPSEISVSGLKQGSIRDVNLKLRGFSHGFPDDVGVLVVGPKGQKALVMSDVGGGLPVSSTNLVNLNLDDEAATSLPDDDQITAGTFKPTQGTNSDIAGDNPVPTNFPPTAPVGPYASSLSVFDGTNPNGTWKLFVIDDSGGDTSEFGVGWTLRIKARVTV